MFMVSQLSLPSRLADPRIRWPALDCAWWVFAIMLATWLRLDFSLTATMATAAPYAAVLSAAVHLVCGCLLGPYLVNYVRGSFEEVVAVARACLITAVLLLVWTTAIGDVFIPRSVPVAAGAFALTTMMASRFVVRAYRAHHAARRASDRRVLVFGAGLAGRRLVHNLLHDDQSQYLPVAFIDDDRAKRRMRSDGVQVCGTRKDIAAVAAQHDATHLVVAIPAASAELLREVRAVSVEAGLRLKVLPTIDHILGGDPRVSDLRDLDLEDLLGRRAVQLDQNAIADKLTDRIVLVTGAGGSIGAELCRQIARFRPARLVLLDRDESALHSTQLSLTGRGLLEGDDLLLADIRDRAALTRVFGDIRPDVVFHAAALKHLPLLEKHPLEAWQTNVLGSLNVLTAAANAGVGTFVNISTDKAAGPTSVLGYTKRIAERLTADFAASCPGSFVSVRFGNVLGSRGSVIPVFTEQIHRGHPITVTDPQVERYFMLIPEACQLVMQASAMGGNGEVLVLDMGKPVKIAEVARTLIEISGRPVPIVYTGLRPGEKLSEDLFTDQEDRRPTGHPLVNAVDVPALAPWMVMEVPFVTATVTEEMRGLALTEASRRSRSEGVV